MVISFSEQRAFEQLKRGGVVTFRPDERERTPRDEPQETWSNRGRGEPKEFDVLVFHLAEQPAVGGHFDALASLSGFDSVEDWKQAVLRLHGDFPPTGHFYYVTPMQEDL